MRENAAIARVLVEIANLLELTGENVFKIKAYRTAAETLLRQPARAADLTEGQLRDWPGIGKELSARIPEIAVTGTSGLHQKLLSLFPATLTELLDLQGIGAKTVVLLYKELGIASTADLEDALKTGRVRQARGIGEKKAEQIARALQSRQSRSSQHLLSEAVLAADALVAMCRDLHPLNRYEIAGEVRRGLALVGRVDLLAVGSDAEVLGRLATSPRVEQLLARDDVSVSLLLGGGWRIEVQLVTPEAGGAALIAATGAPDHIASLQARASERGLVLRHDGLFHTDGARIAHDTEEGVYRALGLDWIAPELREGTGETEAAANGSLPALLERGQLRGDLHMHSTASDGKDTVDTMAAAARAAGLEYIAITDHSRALSMAGGLDEARALDHAARIHALNQQLDGITLLAGIECDILPDGRMDLADECLAQLDLVIGSVHSAMQQSEADMTSRVLRAAAHPWVDIIAHPTSRRLLRREPTKLDVPALIEAAVAHGTALEINGQAERMDLPEQHARAARDRGVNLVVSSDAHSTRSLALTRWSVTVARRAGLEARDVLNTRPLDDMRRALKRSRSKDGGP